MNCTIRWNRLSPEEWETRFAQTTRSNLLQSFDYARAVCPLNRQRARWGEILFDGVEAGLVQAFEAGLLWNAVHALIVDRGPLWFDGFGKPGHVRAFFEEFNRQFPKRPGRKRRVLPELPDDPSLKQTLTATGLRHKGESAAYQTIWLDLTQEEDQLRKNLRQKWRNALNKGERQGLEVSWDWDGKGLAWLLAAYETDKQAKGYDGPGLDLLTALARVMVPKRQFGIVTAAKKGKPIGAILVIRHGAAATYQIGWTNEEGRAHSAHHVLLWEATKVLKHMNVRDFDLGGLTGEADGLARFKSGLGGEAVTLAGHYV
jgi:hypothetical protein